MNPIVTTAFKHLTSMFTKSDASTGRASGAPFQQWDKKHFERWTQASTDERLGRRQKRQEYMASQARSSYAMFYQ